MIQASEFFVVDEGVTIPLHYIGRRYYTPATFAAEAKKFGVSRVLPAKTLKKFKWGDRIFLAFHGKDKKGPYALIFGYFTIRGINVGNDVVREAVNKDERIKVKETIDYGSGIPVKRGCGEYIISSTTVVDNKFSELIEVIEDVAKKLGVKVKILTSGPFTKLPLVKLRGAKFTRSITYAKVPPELLEYFNLKEPTGLTKRVNYLKDYKLAKPSKKRKEKVFNEKLDKWLEV